MTGTDAGATISVLIPSFNPGPYLPAALDSAFAQLGEHDEIVVQDAGSTDGTAEVLARRSAADPRLRVVTEPDDGQSDALNRCLARAVGAWCVWLNADDLLVDGALDAVREVIAAEPDVDLVIGGHRIVRMDGDVVDEFTGRRLDVGWMTARGCGAFSGSIAMRTDVLRRVGGIDGELHTVMDLELQLRLAAASPPLRQTVIEHPIGALRFHEASKTATLWWRFVAESHRIRLRHVRTPAERLVAIRATGLHAGMRWVFRLRLTPGYRAVRRRVTDAVAVVRR